MSSTAVASQERGLAEIVDQLKALRGKAERYRADASDPTTQALYASLSRDLFDLTSKASSYAGITDPQPRLPFGVLRTKDLKQSDQAVLMAFLAEQVRAYIELQGGSFSTSWAVSSLAQRLHTTQDELWYGITYGEQAGLFASEGGTLVLLPQEA